MEAEGIPGLAVTIVKDGRAVSEAFGYRDLGRRLPMTADTLIPLASVSKGFVGLMVMQLVEAGKLSLDEPVTRYLPAFRLSDAEATARITPRLMLAHLTGLARLDHVEKEVVKRSAGGRGPGDRQVLLDVLTEQPLQTPPNVAFAYSNEAYDALGTLIDVVSGRPVEEHLEQFVFGPAEMSRSRARLAEWLADPDRAVSYANLDGELRVHETSPELGYVGLASGLISSTAADMGRYHLALHDRREGRLLSAGGVLQLQSPTAVHGDTGWGYGLGWNIAWSAGRRVASHSGGLEGISTFNVLVPDEGVAVTVLANKEDAKPAHLAERLANTVLSQPLYQAVSGSDLSFRTRFPALETSQLAAYAGEYGRPDGPRLVVTPATGTGRLQVVHHRPEGRPLERLGVPIGPNLFKTVVVEPEPMLLQESDSGAVMRFLADETGRPDRLLTGGYSYQR